MFTDLPFDAQEKVRDALSAGERARLMMALPKPCASRLRKDPATEKKLGVLATAIRKKRLKRLTRDVREFLEGQDVDKRDPTLAEMAVHIPEVVDVIRARPQTLESATDRNAFLDMVARAAPEDATRVTGHPMYAERKTDVWFECMIRNVPLLEAIAALDPVARAEIHDYVKKNAEFCTHDLDSLRSLLRMVSLSREELENVYAYAVGNMYIECALFVDGLLA